MTLFQSTFLALASMAFFTTAVSSEPTDQAKNSCPAPSDFNWTAHSAGAYEYIEWTASAGEWSVTRIRSLGQPTIETVISIHSPDSLALACEVKGKTKDGTAFKQIITKKK